jgi:hypothetical protein
LSQNEEHKTVKTAFPIISSRALYSVKHFTVVMRLCHQPDDSTSPKYTLLCFKPP